MARGIRFVVACVLAAAPGVALGQVVRSGAGTDAASIVTARDLFRLDLGGGTVAGANGSFGGVRREINWDGVPAALAAPNNLPFNFFNVNSPRGVIFATPGTGVQVSAATTDGSGQPADFGNINPAYTATFAPFSAQRLFTAIGSNIVDVSFFLPGTTTPALTRGFGAVFSDVDLAGSTSLQFFGLGNALLGTFFVPAVQGSETFSFLGVSFADAIVSRVRITSGNAPLAAGLNDGGGVDLVVMDDFIYGEPGALSTVPEPATVWLFATGLLVLGGVGGRRRTSGD